MHSRVSNGGLALFVAILAWVIPALAYSAERATLPFPEIQQRQQAMMAAAEVGDSDGLDDPEAMAIQVALPVTEEPEPSKIEMLAEENLEPINLEDQILDQSFDAELEQFGYEMFSALPTTFAPVMDIPVPGSYLVGPGDVFTVQIYGAADLQYTLTVTREGNMLVPELGSVQVAGLTFDEVKLRLSKLIGEARVGAQLSVTLSKLQTIQVLIVGEVVQPGSYTVSGLSSVLNTLVSAGGIKRTGSLRSIELRRNSELVDTLDVYDLLMRGSTKGNANLRHGDVIFIPPIGRIVSVAGEVKRPAIYEIKEEETVSDVINLAGGLLPSAARDKAQMERVTSAGSYTLIQSDLTSEGLLLPIKDGDLLRIFPVINKMENVVLLSGSVLIPGGYEWKDGMTVSELIGSTRNLKQGSDLSTGLIEREDLGSKKTVVTYFNLGEALRSPGSNADPILKPRDRILVFDTHTERKSQVSRVVDKVTKQTPASDLPPTVEFRGFVRHPGIYPLESGLRLLDMLGNAGGVAVGLDTDYSLLVRTNSITKEIEFITLDIGRALTSPNGDHNPVLTAGDKVYLFDRASEREYLFRDDIERLKAQTGFGELTPVVEVSGSVRMPGVYPLTPGMNVDDLISAAGGMAEEAYGLSVTLARRNLLDGDRIRTDNYSVSLLSDNQMLQTKETILEPYDHLFLRQKPNWITKPKRVSVKGEIVYPGVYEVDKGETLCGLVGKAGGFTEDAYLFGAVFTRESVRAKEQAALDRINRELDDLLADVHLSPGYDKTTKLPVNQSTFDTFKVIQRLKPETATGRMVIDLEAAAKNCSEGQDFVLENGDSLFIPKVLDEVSVVGQVYFPSSHRFESGRGAYDYINLSGGTKELAQREHVYIVQANGAVISSRSPASTWGWLGSPKNVKVTPGATIYVPLSVDRINGREFTESWIDIFYKLTLSAASVDFLFGN